MKRLPNISKCLPEIPRSCNVGIPKDGDVVFFPQEGVIQIYEAPTSKDYDRILFVAVFINDKISWIRLDVAVLLRCLVGKTVIYNK